MAVKLDGSGQAIIRTMADLKAMSGDEVNQHWQAVARVLETNGEYLEIDDDEAPQSLADLKGKPSTYVNRHWPTVVKLLEKSAKVAADERRAKVAA